MTAAILTADLMLSSQVAGAAARTRQPLRTFSSTEPCCTALAEEPVELLLIDLALPALDVTALIQRLRELPGGAPRTLAFGSHVHHGRLAAAREAGCDEVLSRGQFHAQMDQLLRVPK
jgi:CheY-like chemotaxis protein